ncbi:tRNA lysidine(34) synthetase TilS [Candidatus Saccharibacteria bacterium]|nr:MAG: tRNA lysidine(34) synthetase TilS [Candidatus Saccharibacteria bacterium]
MKYIVAVSGGVDSVVLLDLLLYTTEADLIVAHVDHGIRPDSAADARFVKGLAEYYGVEYVATRLELGPRTGEAAARQARYKFLEAQAARLQARIVTAHHRDDVIGSIAINLSRGTGWRGLAVLGRGGVVRPLRSWTKSDIYNYALTHRLEWVEDTTNHSTRYLRNRLRASVVALPQAVAEQVAHLARVQRQLVDEIDSEVDRLLEENAGSRYFYTQIDPAIACTLLRRELVRATGSSATMPQLERALLHIKTARANTIHDIGDGRRIVCGLREFVVRSHL